MAMLKIIIMSGCFLSFHLPRVPQLQSRSYYKGKKKGWMFLICYSQKIKSRAHFCNRSPPRVVQKGKQNNNNTHPLRNKLYTHFYFILPEVVGGLSLMFSTTGIIAILHLLPLSCHLTKTVWKYSVHQKTDENANSLFKYSLYWM